MRGCSEARGVLSFSQHSCGVSTTPSNNPRSEKEEIRGESFAFLLFFQAVHLLLLLLLLLPFSPSPLEMQCARGVGTTWPASLPPFLPPPAAAANCALLLLFLLLLLSRWILLSFREKGFTKGTINIFLLGRRTGAARAGAAGDAATPLLARSPFLFVEDVNASSAWLRSAIYSQRKRDRIIIWRGKEGII